MVTCHVLVGLVYLVFHAPGSPVGPIGPESREADMFVSEEMASAYMNSVDKSAIKPYKKPEQNAPHVSRRTGNEDMLESGPYFQGDIKISASRNGIKNVAFRWPEGVIPYELDRKYSKTDQDTFQQVFEEYKAKSCVRFVPHTFEENYLYITKDSVGCFSNIGNQRTGKQVVNLASPGCNTKGTIMHELMHSVGFWHEQNRSDRDEFIDIHLENVPAAHQQNFLIKTKQESLTYGLPYDYGSILHYSDTAFTSNGEPTMVAKKPLNGLKMGTKLGFSPSDIERINIMYNCYVKRRRG